MKNEKEQNSTTLYNIQVQEEDTFVKTPEETMQL
jgi:hypothetical protein